MFKNDYSTVRKALKFVSLSFFKNFDFGSVYTLTICDAKEYYQI